jgi:hypothetical protein
MLDLLAFAVVAVALATPFVVPLMWGQGQKTLVGALTVCAALIAASDFMQAADAQQRPLPNDPERVRMIENCVETTFGRPAGKEHILYQACIDELDRQSSYGLLAREQEKSAGSRDR